MSKYPIKTTLTIQTEAPKIETRSTSPSSSTPTTRSAMSRTSIAIVPETLTAAIETSLTIDKTPFDRYLSPLGLSALKPIILSYLDFENFYQPSGDLTGTGQIYYMQRRVSEETVSAASTIAKKYLLSHPQINKKLKELSSNNLKIATEIAEQMSNFQDAKEDLYNATFEYALGNSAGLGVQQVEGEVVIDPQFLPSSAERVETPKSAYKVTTGYDSHTSDLLDALNTRFIGTSALIQGASIDNISKSALTLSLLRGAISRLNNPGNTFKYSNIENQKYSTTIQNLSSNNSTAYDNLEIAANYSTTTWKNIINGTNSSDTEAAAVLNNIENDLLNATDGCFYSLSSYIITKNNGENLNETTETYIGLDPTSEKTVSITDYLTNSSKIKPILSFNNRPVLIQDVDGSSSEYDTLLSVLVNNASTENIQTIIDKITEVEKNILEFKDKLYYVLNDDIVIIFYDSLYALFVNYIESSFLARIVDNEVSEFNSPLRFISIVCSDNELFAKVVAVIMIRNSVDKEDKDTEFNQYYILSILAAGGTTVFNTVASGETSLNFEQAFKLAEDSDGIFTMTGIESLNDISHGSFDYFYEFALDFLSRIGLDPKTIEKNQLNKIILISIFHFRYIMQSFLSKCTIGEISSFKSGSTTT